MLAQYCATPYAKIEHSSTLRHSTHGPLLRNSTIRCSLQRVPTPPGRIQRLLLPLSLPPSLSSGDLHNPSVRPAKRAASRSPLETRLKRHRRHQGTHTSHLVKSTAGLRVNEDLQHDLYDPKSSRAIAVASNSFEPLASDDWCRRYRTMSSSSSSKGISFDRCPILRHP